MVKVIRKENYITEKKSGIIELLNALSRYYSGRKLKNINKKLMKIGLEKVAKTENISKNELNQAENCKKSQQMN